MTEDDARKIVLILMHRGIVTDQWNDCGDHVVAALLKAYRDGHDAGAGKSSVPPTDPALSDPRG